MPKKRTYISVSDKPKAWAKRAEPAAYKIDEVATNKLILIVGEGQTEKLYFESFPVLTLTVKAVDLGGQSKLKLIEQTEAIIKSSDNDYNEVWCVFDMDVNQGEKEFADFDNAISQGRAKGYKIAYSNDAFELWFYLHFHYTDQQNLRGFYYQALGEKWNCNYEKDGKVYKFCEKIYEKLDNDPTASQAKAIEWAEKLYKAQADLPYHKQNPVTKVYELVRLLNENCRK